MLLSGSPFLLETGVLKPGLGRCSKEPWLLFENDVWKAGCRPELAYECQGLGSQGFPETRAGRHVAANRAIRVSIFMSIYIVKIVSLC